MSDLSTVTVAGTFDDYFLRVVCEGETLDIPLTQERALILIEQLVRVVRASE